MGIEFICGSTHFCCSCTYWDKIQREIIIAMFNYIQYKHDTLPQNDRSYKPYMDELLKLKKYVIENTENDSINIFVQMSKDINFMNALNYFDIGGLVVLCQEYDCEYYSPGNSLDICRLFDIIEPFLKKYSCYDCIYTNNSGSFNTIYEIFENSYNTLRKVTIC